jgi:hypothetical protein
MTIRGVFFGLTIAWLALLAGAGIYFLLINKESRRDS